MYKGFQALSAGYVEDFVKSSRDSGIVIESVASEGRSYVGILHLAEIRHADLIVVTRHGPHRQSCSLDVTGWQQLSMGRVICRKTTKTITA